MGFFNWIFGGENSPKIETDEEFIRRYRAELWAWNGPSAEQIREYEKLEKDPDYIAFVKEYRKEISK